MPTITSYFGFILAASTITPFSLFWSEHDTTYFSFIE